MTIIIVLTIINIIIIIVVINVFSIIYIINYERCLGKNGLVPFN